jgi:esterase/lipase superfamily enzyme
VHRRTDEENTRKFAPSGGEADESSGGIDMKSALNETLSVRHWSEVTNDRSVPSTNRKTDFTEAAIADISMHGERITWYSFIHSSSRLDKCKCAVH